MKTQLREGQIYEAYGDLHLLEWLPASPHTGNNGLVVQQDVANAFRPVDDEDTESPDRGTGAQAPHSCSNSPAIQIKLLARRDLPRPHAVIIDVPIADGHLDRWR